MRLEVDTCRLTVLRTQRAVLTLLCVEMNLQEREAADEAKDGAYRAYRVTIRASVAPSQYSESNKCYSGNNERYSGANPDVRLVERVAVVMLSDTGQYVVACLPDGLKQIRCNASKGRVGGQELELTDR